MNPPPGEPAPQPRPEAPPRDDLTPLLRRASRRGFTTAGVAALAGLGAWRWLVTSEPDAGIPWPLRRILLFNESLARATFRPDARAADFDPRRAGEPRVNGLIGMTDADGDVLAPDADSWLLTITSDSGPARSMTLDDIRALPRAEQTTELKCIEGWSTVVHWAGARLADLAALTGLVSRAAAPYDRKRPPADLLPYVALATPDGGYYVGLDAPGALHEQTLLAYEMNGAPLTPGHGAPLRLVIPIKYGIKNIKRIGSIHFTDRRPADYWAERGYDWYAGH